MAIQKRNAAHVELLNPDLVANQGELHLSAAAVNATPYTANKTTVLLCTTGAGNLVVDLPLAANNYGKVYAIKKIDAGAGGVVVTPNLAAVDLIDGAASYTIANRWEAIVIVSDGGNDWYKISLT